jgi:hypothetical protein
MKIRKFNEEFDYNEEFEENDDNYEQAKKLFIKALNTLFWSWGGDAPPEATWTANELLNYYEVAHNVELGIRFQDEDGTDFDDVIEAIENS